MTITRETLELAALAAGHIMTPREHWCGEFSTLHNPA